MNALHTHTLTLKLYTHAHTHQAHAQTITHNHTIIQSCKHRPQPSQLSAKEAAPSLYSAPTAAAKQLCRGCLPSTPPRSTATPCRGLTALRCGTCAVHT